MLQSRLEGGRGRGGGGGGGGGLQCSQAVTSFQPKTLRTPFYISTYKRNDLSVSAFSFGARFRSSTRRTEEVERERSEGGRESGAI